jgi:hypothetical protein
MVRDLLKEIGGQLYGVAADLAPATAPEVG